MNPHQALSNLVTAARAARLTAEEHEAVQESIKILLNLVQNTPQLTNSKSNSKGNEGNSK